MHIWFLGVCLQDKCVSAYSRPQTQETKSEINNKTKHNVVPWQCPYWDEFDNSKVCLQII